MTALHRARERVLDAVLDTFGRDRRAQLRSLIILAGAAVLVHFAWTLARRLTYAGINYDETYFLWGGWSLNQGLVPYRDFQDFKPPMVFVTNALALGLFGLKHQRFAFFFTGLSIGSLVALYFALVRRATRPLLALLVTALIAHLWFLQAFHDSGLDDAESIGLGFYFLGVAALLWGGRRPAIANGLGGALLALAVLSKEPFALAVAGTWVALGFAIRDWGAGPRFLVYARQTLTGVAVALVLVLGGLAVAGGLGPYLRLVSSYGKLGTVCVRVGIAPPLTGLPALWNEAWTKLQSHLLLPGRVGALVPFFVAFAIVRREGWGARLSLVGTVAVSLLAVAAGRCFFAHYFLLGIAGLGLWAALGARAASQAIADRKPVLQGLVLLGACVVVIPSVWPRYEAESAAVYGPHDYVGYGSCTDPQTVDFVARNSARSDTVFTDGCPGMYVFAGRRSATRESAFLDEFLDMYTGTTDVERVEGLRAQLEAHRPKIVFLDPAYAARKRRHRDALLAPFLRDHGYQRVGDFYLRPGH